MIKRFWRWLRQPHPRYALGAIALVGVVAGVVFWGGFHTVLELTNTESFCISCHEMRDNVYKEYVATPHYKNASGVRASCPDCHVPREWGPKLVAKTLATKDLYHKLLGTIATPEKFEENRLAMARRVWDDMTATNSRECRNCHSSEAMDFHKMAKADGAERMKKGLEAGETCISCHKGIAHKLPDMSQGYRSMLKEIAAGAAKAKPGKGDAVISYKTGALFADVANATPDAAGEGKLLAATEAKVLDTKGDWLKVRIEGWQQEGAERVIYALRGQRILSAALGPELVEKLQRETPAEDPETGLVWAKVGLDAWIARTSVTPEQAPLWAYGDELYRASCGTCHNLPPPGHTLANQWSGTLNAMKRFISLDDEEYRFLLKYLQFNAKDTGGKDHG